MEASWQTNSGSSGPAHAVALTPDSGYFWFFSPSNVEMIVKSLNGCGLNNAHWFFGAGLTNVAVEVRVTDSQTSEVRTYANPLGSVFQPIQDTSAFLCP